MEVTVQYTGGAGLKIFPHCPVYIYIYIYKIALSNSDLLKGMANLQLLH